MNESFHISYSPEAVEDLRGIYVYIAFELLVPETAERQVNRIREKVRSLDFMPERYALVEWDPWKSRNAYRVSADSYVIFYMVNSEFREVRILRILYCGRDMKQILQSE